MSGSNEEETGNNEQRREQRRLFKSQVYNTSLTEDEKAEVWVLLRQMKISDVEWLLDDQSGSDLDKVLRAELREAAAARPRPPPSGAAGPPYRALDVLRKKYNHTWEVEICSNTSTNWSYSGLEKDRWRIETEQAELKTYLQSKLGNITLDSDPTPQEIRHTAPLTSENDCNRMFCQYYGDPVAEIVTQLYGQQISFHLNPPTEPGTGEPDFTFSTTNHKELLRGEGKTPSVLKCAASLFPPKEDATVNKCCKQICSYMRLKNMRYGFLTHLNGTYFVKRTSEGPNYYRFTRALPTASIDITVLEMLTYILLKQLEEGPWPAVPAHLPAIRVQQGPDLSNTQNASSSNTTGPMTPSKAAVNQQPVQGMASSSGTLHSHPEEALQVMSKRLGAGQCGIVIEGRFYGETSAIKGIDLSKRYNQVSLLTNEINTYGHLTPLQGQCIPALKGYGLWDNGNTMFLAMSVAEGEHPSRYTYGAREIAVKALQRIHAMGVLHGDISPENILISKKDTDWQVWFLDFGHSSMSSDPAAQESELQELMDMFREFSDSGASGSYSKFISSNMNCWSAQGGFSTWSCTHT